MKDSFETFPKLVADPTTNEKNIIAWKKRIEKELRERLTKHDCTANPCLFSKIIREILGE